jgi:hypothetical protein
METPARVQFRARMRGEDGVHRVPGEVPTLSVRFVDERLVLVQVRRAFLQVHRPSVRLHLEPDVVYSANGTHGQKAKAAVPISRIFGRHPDIPCKGREDCCERVKISRSDGYRPLKLSSGCDCIIEEDGESSRHDHSRE